MPIAELLKNLEGVLPAIDYGKKQNFRTDFNKRRGVIGSPKS